MLFYKEQGGPLTADRRCWEFFSKWLSQDAFSGLLYLFSIRIQFLCYVLKRWCKKKKIFPFTCIHSIEINKWRNRKHMLLSFVQTVLFSFFLSITFHFLFRLLLFLFVFKTTLTQEIWDILFLFPNNNNNNNSWTVFYTFNFPLSVSLWLLFESLQKKLKFSFFISLHSNRKFQLVNEQFLLRKCG